ncbi:MAG: 3-methyl-2-oxobutanoate hydroxymethyltransferase [Candidatus Aminicenantes bacterium]|jgi:3-methyl-2-oxobutanoate hydroxymethyltransferase|nr:3-methyl-2-oxobutanoate hydroxymethyltransferase [Candidatus Aminicenantes bacterium]
MIQKPEERVTVCYLHELKKQKQKIIALTAYDYPTARILDECGVDILLVGDSLGMAVLGYENTLPVTMEEMLHHTRAVTRARKRAMVIGDMPYLSFHLSLEDTIKNAARFIKEGGADGIKLEGASQHRLQLVKALVEAEIPVMGHVGLTPQSVQKIGGFKVQGTDEEKAEAIFCGALELEKAGAFAIVLESIPQELAREITAALKIPTIGIGAGPECDGQVLVINDLLGLTSGYLPRFVKKYVDLQTIISKAVNEFIHEVKEGYYPAQEHCYHLKAEKAGMVENLRARVMGKDNF